MATPFHVELVTPERVLFSGEAEEVSMRTDEGEIAFLAHHEDFVGAMDITVVRITGAAGDAGSSEESSELRAAVHGGFVRVNDDGVRILASVAELADEIDVERARQALQRGEERLASDGPSELVRPGSEEAAGVALRGAALAMLAPDSPEAAIARAKARLEGAGAPVTV